MTIGSNKIILLLFVLISVVSRAQLVREGKIVYERRTNLYKIFDDERMRSFIKEKDKIKIENFSLYFNDSVSLFSYIQPETPDQMSWATMKNTVYTSFQVEKRSLFMEMMGNSMLVTDSLVQRQWKITDKTRKIAGYECIRAIWQKDDTTRIYAWFTTDIIPTVGPESVQGLPGAVLGLAKEDGSVVYFATSVDKIAPTVEQITSPKKKGKEYTEEELLAELRKKLNGQPYADRILTGIFFW